MRRSLILSAGAGLLVLLAGCGGGEAASGVASAAPPVSATTVEPTPAEPTPAQKQEVPPGAYIDYAEFESEPQAYAAGDVVLFFNATWCPTCQEAVKNLESARFPDGLTVVSVDYDSNLDLRKKYGVTTQHTFVQVTPDGEQVKKFTGSTTIPQIQDELA